MSICKDEIKEFPYLQKLFDVMEALEIPITELFWDENEMGQKPDEYAVYHSVREQEDLSSDDDTECDCANLTVSFYVKGKFRKIKRAAKKEFLAAGFFLSEGFETYETDTRYNHFDFELKYYM